MDKNTKKRVKHIVNIIPYIIGNNAFNKQVENIINNVSSGEKNNLDSKILYLSSEDFSSYIYLVMLSNYLETIGFKIDLFDLRSDVKYSDIFASPLSNVNVRKESIDYDDDSMLIGDKINKLKPAVNKSKPGTLKAIISGFTKDKILEKGLLSLSDYLLLARFEGNDLFELGDLYDNLEPIIGKDKITVLNFNIKEKGVLNWLADHFI